MKKLAKQQNQQFTAPAGNTYTFVQSQPYQMQQQYRQMPPQDCFLNFFIVTYLLRNVFCNHYVVYLRNSYVKFFVENIIRLPWHLHR